MAICPKFWEMTDDGKARLKGGEKNSETGDHELEIKKSECNQEAADACPVQIIFLRD